VRRRKEAIATCTALSRYYVCERKQKDRSAPGTFIKPSQHLGYPARKKIQNDPMQEKAKNSFKWTGQISENGKRASKNRVWLCRERGIGTQPFQEASTVGTERGLASGLVYPFRTLEHS